MEIQIHSRPHRQREAEETSSALAYWGTGAICLAILVFVFWLAGMTF